jgi:hypothetical protein
MRRQAAIIVCGVIGILLLCLVVTSLSPGPPQTATLSDGTVLRLDRWSYGHRHSAGGLPNWAEVKSMISRGQFRRWRYETAEETLVVWITSDRPSRIPYQIRDPAFKYGEGNTPPGPLVQAGPTSRLITGFKRRGPYILVDVDDYNSTGMTTVATWKIPNPVKQQFSQWTPKALPQTQTVDGLSFVLDRYRIIYGSRAPRDVLFQFSCGDSNIAVSAAKLSDPTFNFQGMFASDPQMQAEFTCFLDATEPVWQLHTEFTSTTPQTNQIWAITLPASNSPPLSLERDFVGTKVRVSGPEIGRSGRTAIVIHTSSPERVTVRLAEIRDSTGRVITGPRPVHAWPVSPTQLELPIGQIPPSAIGQVTIKLVIKKTYPVDFYFNPMELR